MALLARPTGSHLPAHPLAAPPGGRHRTEWPSSMD